MPNDFALPAPLDTQEGQDTYLTAAFASGHPVLIADAVNAVDAARRKAGIPTDESWETTRDLYKSVEDTQRMLQAVAETEAYLKATGQTLIVGPTTK